MAASKVLFPDWGSPTIAVFMKTPQVKAYKVR